jgi:DNA polymerase III subunit alpha
MNDFVHLHVHSQYSLLDGANRLDLLLEQAKRYNMSSLAITDHGNLFGAIEFYQKAKKAGIKPIIGCEAYLAPKSRFDRDTHSQTDDAYLADGQEADTPYYHLILLAASEQGYRNLIKLTTQAHLEGFYYKPRIDKEILAKHGQGLIATSGCLRGEIPFLLNLGKKEDAIRAARHYQEIFGKENFFIEIQENGLEKQERINRELFQLAQQLSIPVVGTNDCHYLHKGDARAHDVLLCLQTGKTLKDPRRMRFNTEQLYFKSSEEMSRLFTQLPQAVSNTRLIAERCDLRLSFDQFHLPNYEVPAGNTLEEYLDRQARAGLAHHLQKLSPNLSQRTTYEQRLTEELRIINSMGYAGYFLIVWDIVNYARANRIPVGPGRGSAAGSLVAYCLRITDIDPLPYGLIFERFLNPERITLPDIDIDFCVDRRGALIDYVTQKYGKDHVAQIITFGTMAAKAAIRDVGRVMEIPYAEVDRVAKLIPNVLNISLDEAVQSEPRLQELAQENSHIAELLSLAKSLEGLARHASTHAAGVVISKEPLTEHVPLYRGTNGEIVTQYAKDDIEKIGLVKFDFLGLRNLTVIDSTLKLVSHKQPDESILNPSEIPIADSGTYELLSSGQTTGVFQLESPGMRDLLTRLRPERFEDLIAILALYRPGPIGSGMVDDFIKRKRKKIPIKYEVPQLEEILKETYGVIVYQEQVMKIANVLAGFSLQEADLLRRAMGKKLPEEIDKQKGPFIEGAKKNGISLKKAEKIYNQMAHFGGYGFNKSHSAAYALITYQTAYLKAHHPLEFMTALLTSEMGNEDKVVRYIGECRAMGIKVLPPDVNECDISFTMVPEGIRFGLAAVKNVGETAMEAIVAAREAKGRFTSLFDFCSKVDLRKVNRRVAEGLIKSGAFDSLKTKRSQLMQQLEQTMEEAGLQQDEQARGQASLFQPAAGTDRPAMFPSHPSELSKDLPEWDEALLLKYERETLGFYITSHPLMRYQELLQKMGTTSTEALADLQDGKEVRCCGVISSKKQTTTKKGDKMAYFKLEDLAGSVEVIVFPDLYATTASRLGSAFEGDEPLLVHGILDRGEKGIKIKATRIESISTDSQVPAKGLVLDLPKHSLNRDEFMRLKEILSRHRGPCSVHLRLDLPEGESVIALDSSLTISPTQALLTELEEAYGKKAVVLQYEE